MKFTKKIAQHREHTKHGMSGSPEYKAWAEMLQRCENKNHPKYSDYGGREIIVCKRWQNVLNFLTDMGSRPDAQHNSIDRIDVNGNYEPSNCRWATNKEQCNNKRNNRCFMYKGRSRTMMQVAEEAGIDHQTLRYRLVEAGMSVEEATKKPVRSLTRPDNYGGLFEHNGESHTLKEWAMLKNIKYRTLTARICDRGYTLAEALERGAPKSEPRYRYEGDIYSARELAAKLGITTDGLKAKIGRRTIKVDFIDD